MKPHFLGSSSTRDSPVTSPAEYVPNRPSSACSVGISNSGPKKKNDCVCHVAAIYSDVTLIRKREFILAAVTRMAVVNG